MKSLRISSTHISISSSKHNYWIDKLIASSSTGKFYAKLLHPFIALNIKLKYR